MRAPPDRLKLPGPLALSSEELTIGYGSDDNGVDGDDDHDNDSGGTVHNSPCVHWACVRSTKPRQPLMSTVMSNYMSTQEVLPAGMAKQSQMERIIELRRKNKLYGNDEWRTFRASGRACSFC